MAEFTELHTGHLSKDSVLEEGLVKAVVGGRRLLACFLGTSGRNIGVQLKAWLIRSLGTVPESIQIRAFDVDPRQETVWVDTPRGRIPVTLEPDIEFFVLGRDLHLARVASEAVANPDLHQRTIELLRRQPDGRLPKTVERGAEGEPLVGLAVWQLSLGTTGKIIRSALRRLSELRLADDDSGPMVMTALVGASLVGGCGSAMLLPAVKEIREAMEDLGIDVDGSLFVELAMLPEAFPETDVRRGVTWSTLQHHSTAFREGRLPFASEHTPPGEPFNLPLLCAPVTESGYTLRGVDDLAEALGLVAMVLGSYPLREAAAGF